MGAADLKDKINPFPGLRPFRTDESDLFFGRENESTEVFNKLISNRFLAIIGASGSGKSSLVYSGLVPKMTGMASSGKSSLKLISFQPGSDPLNSLANAFAKTVLGDIYQEDAGEKVIEKMKEDPQWIAGALKNIVLKPGEKVLMIVDQFEELFTYRTAGEGLSTIKHASEFVILLENAVRQKETDAYIVIVMRSDYVGECAHFHGLTQLINDSNYLVPRMKWENYKNVIEKPVRHAGAEIDKKLVVAILNDLGDQSDPLPVLQHTMMRAFSFWLEMNERDRPVGLSDYTAAGTISGAMSAHANEAYEELSPEDKDICMKIFKAITGKGNDNRGIRNPLSLISLVSVTDYPRDKLCGVIEKFRTPARSFILPVSEIPLNDKTVIDISHESLIRLWDRLKEWVDDEASAVRMYRKLSETASMYQQGKASLLKQPDLQLALKWREMQKPTLSWAERYDPAFERVMVYLRTSEKAFLDEEAKKLKQQTRKIKSSKKIAIFLGIAAFISIVFMLVAFMLKSITEKEKREAEKQKVEAAEKAAAAEINALEAQTKLLVADSIAEVSRKKQMEAGIAAEVARRNQLLAFRRSDSALQISRIAEKNVEAAIEQKNAALRKKMVATGRALALKSMQIPEENDLQGLLAYQGYIFNRRNGGYPNDADIYAGLYNVARKTGNINYKPYEGHAGEIKSVAFVPGRREFYTSGSDGKVLKWNLDNKDRSIQVVYSGSEIINVLAVSPDAGWLACGSTDSNIKMIPVKGNNIGYELKGHSGEIKSLIFSYDGKNLYSASLDGKVLKWDLNTRSSTDISGNLIKVTSIDLSSDNNYIAGVNVDGKVVVWNPEANNDNFRIESPGRKIRTVKFKPDEDILAVGYDDGRFEVWDIDTRTKMFEVSAHKAAINNIRFNNKLSQIATSSVDGTLKLWNTEDITTLPVVFDDSEGLVIVIEFSPDGEVFVSGTTGGKANLLGRPAAADLLAADICRVISRNFTMNEWLAYIGREIEYEETCSQGEPGIRVRELR